MLKGIGVSGGYGIGNVVLLDKEDLSFEDRSGCDPTAEKERYWCRRRQAPAKRRYW